MSEHGNFIMPNGYSTTWFTTFLQSIPPSQSESEITFVTRHLPRPRYISIVDLCCGAGRHTYLLAEQGYRVIGVDLNPIALAKAKRLPGNKITYVAQDIRHFVKLPGTFDAILILWQSFGYFDEATNRNILYQINQQLTPGGRLILDIYHRNFFEQHQGTHSFVKGGISITESKCINGNRLRVNLNYGNGDTTDVFDWQVYTPEELQKLAEVCGFQCLIACTGFDEKMSPSPEKSRMQFVFEKESK